MNSTKARVLQADPVVEINPTMVQIPQQTLFGLILLFTLFLPVLYIGISCLYGIETPEKYATQNYVVGKEYWLIPSLYLLSITIISIV